MPLSLIENSWYDHEEYGRVRLIRIDEDAETVLLERAETTHVSGVGDIPAGARDSLDSFTQAAAPADISVSPPVVEIDAEAPEIQQYRYSH